MWGFFPGAGTQNWNSSGRSRGAWAASKGLTNVGVKERSVPPELHDGSATGETIISATIFCFSFTCQSQSPPRRSLPFSERIITKNLCFPKACWFGSLLLFLFLLKAKIKSHFWPASSCSSVAQPRQSAQGKISLAGAPKSLMTTAEDNFIWKNTSELKVLHLYSLLEGWKEVNHPQGWWASVNLISAKELPPNAANCPGWHCQFCSQACEVLHMVKPASSSPNGYTMEQRVGGMEHESGMQRQLLCPPPSLFTPKIITVFFFSASYSFTRLCISQTIQKAEKQSQLSGKIIHIHGCGVIGLIPDRLSPPKKR